MGIETLDIPFRQDVAERHGDIVRDVTEVGFAGRLPLESGDGGVGLLEPGLKLLDGLFKRAIPPRERVTGGGWRVDEFQREVGGGQVDSPFVRLA